MTIRGILYPVKTEPVLTDAQRPEQVTESRWHQPLALPVRLRALATAVVVASGLAAPVFTPTPVEAVTLDKWHAALSQPVLRKSDVATRPSLFFVGSDTATDTRWFAPLSEPVRARALAASQQDVLAYAGADPFPETVSLDRWQQPLSQPTRRKATIQPDALEWSTFTPAALETVTLDKWFADFQRPAFPRGLATSKQDATAYIGADPFPETVSLDRWQQALSEPVRRKPTVHPASASWPPFTTAAAETVTLDKWFAPPSQPVLPKRGLSAHLQNGFTKPVFIPAPFVTTWFVPLAYPVQPLYRGLPAYEQRALAFVKAASFAESVTLDRWEQPLSLPVRRKVSVAYHPSCFWGVLTPATVAPTPIGPLDNPEDFVLYTAEIELWFLTDRET